MPFLIQNVIFHLKEGGSDNSLYENINHLPTVEKQCNYNLLKVICMENIRSTILTYLNTNSIENLCFFVFAFVFFYYLGFLSRTFTNHRTAGEGGVHFFNSSLPLPTASQTLKH